MFPTSKFSGLVAGAFMLAGVGVGVLATSGIAAADGYSDFERWRRGKIDGLPLYLERPAHSTAQDACTPTFLWQGEGNSALTMVRKRDLDHGIELAIKGIQRFGPDQPPTYVDSQGLVHIEVPAGTSSPGRAAWNFTFSFDVALDSANPVLSGYEAFILVDLDKTSKTKYLPLRLKKLVDFPNLPCASAGDYNGYGWVEGNTVRIGDDEGTEKVTQNSQNLGFSYYYDRIDGDPGTPGIQPYDFGPGQFDVVMIIVKKWDLRTLTHVHVVFDVVTAPSQLP
jgi:hypothetical protein